MPYIELTRGMRTLVDEDTFQKYGHLKWCAVNPRGRGFYAARNFPHSIRRQQLKKLSQILLPARKGFMVDHINGNTLDDRMENLRYATRAQNNANRRKRQGKELPLGVHKQVQKYKGRSYSYLLARIQSGGKTICLGTFDTPEEASAAYQKAAIKLHGEFASSRNE